ncbi:MAG: hypothetical protein HY885_06550 [Deltaproteobacteria bacterium]|nr:hypothetical protein [Deltaproteobacteria bacterium]
MPDAAWFRENRKSLEIAGLLLVMALGLFLRLEDLAAWKSEPERAFYQGEPLVTTHDGFFYLSLARDLVDGTYDPVDKKRAVPDTAVRPPIPPLLSVMTAGLHKVFNFSYNWIGVLLPPVLGILLALPMYLLGRFYGGPVMGMTAAATALLSEYYMGRSTLGWYDTDSLNVTFPMACAYCFLSFGVVEGMKRYWYLLAGLVNFVFFIWWWDSAPEIVAGICLGPLFLALVFFYRPSRREGLYFFAVLSVCILAVLYRLGFDYPIRIFNQVMGQFGYISFQEAGAFPNMSITVSEQERTGLMEIVRGTTTNLVSFILAWVGFFWLAIRKPKHSIFLLIPFVLSLLSIFYARRFLIFMAPVNALGLGFVVAQVWGTRQKWKICGYIAPALFLFFTVPPFVTAMSKVNWPKFHPLTVTGMDLAGKQTPDDAVVWAWWDMGYPLRYWSQRGTISDGTYHGGELAVYNAIPFATNDFRLAANFMQFYVARGSNGISQLITALGGNKPRSLTFIKEVLAAGPEKGREIITAESLLAQGEWRNTDDWLRFFFPPDPKPLYLFLESRLIVTDYWWYWLGTWDIAKQEGLHRFYKPYTNVEITDKYARNAKGLDVDLVEGFATIEGKKFQLKDVILRGQGDQFKRHNFHDKGINFEVFLPVNYAVLSDLDIAESVFNKLYLRHIGPKEEYFRPVNLLTPAYQLWVVKGDQLPKNNDQQRKGKDVS